MWQAGRDVPLAGNSVTPDDEPARKDLDRAVRISALALGFAVGVPLAFGLPVGGYWARVGVATLGGAIAGFAAYPLASEQLLDRLVAALPIAWMWGVGGWMLLP